MPSCTSCTSWGASVSQCNPDRQDRVAGVQQHSTAQGRQQWWPDRWTPAHLRHVGVQHVGVRLLLHSRQRRRGRVGAHAAEYHRVHIAMHLYKDCTDGVLICKLLRETLDSNSIRHVRAIYRASRCLMPQETHAAEALQAPSALNFPPAHLRRQRCACDVAQHSGAQHEGRRAVRCMRVTGRRDYRHKAHDRDQPWKMTHYQSGAVRDVLEEGACDQKRTAGAGLFTRISVTDTGAQVRLGACPLGTMLVSASPQAAC